MGKQLKGGCFFNTEESPSVENPPPLTSPWISHYDKIPSLNKSLPDEALSRAWAPYLKYTTEKYGNGIIKAGTVLYHGSTEKNLQFRADKIRSGFIYFGLDPLISFWILSEHQEKGHGYVYQFTVNSDIKADYWNTIEQHPGETPKCKKNPCLHPQVALHCYREEDYMEVTEELTLPWNYLSKLTYNHSYIVDIAKLNQNCKKSIYEWSPIQAIVGLQNGEPNPLPQSN